MTSDDTFMMKDPISARWEAAALSVVLAVDAMSSLSAVVTELMRRRRDSIGGLDDGKAAITWR
jgi:hypothetical protein